jgi:hypothetical protein
MHITNNLQRRDVINQSFVTDYIERIVISRNSEKGRYEEGGA